MKKSLARPILHDTPRQPLTQPNRYTRRNVYRIEQHLKLQCDAALNGKRPLSNTTHKALILFLFFIASADFDNILPHPGYNATFDVIW